MRARTEPQGPQPPTQVFLGELVFRLLRGVLKTPANIVQTIVILNP